MNMLLKERRIEKLLYWALLIWVEVYLQFCVYQFFVGHSGTIRHLVRVAAAVLCAFALLYLFLVRLFAGESFPSKLAYIRSFFSFEQLYMVVLFFWFLLSIAMSQHFFGKYFAEGYFLSQNKAKLITTGVLAFLIFPFAKYAGLTKSRETIDAIVKTLIIPYAIFSVWLLWQYFHGNYVTFPSGFRLQMGPGSVFQTDYHSHNTFAGQAMVMFGLSLYMIASQNTPRKILYSFCAFVFLVFLDVTNSRNYWYCNAFMFCVFMFFLCWKGMPKKKPAVRFVLGFALVALSALLLHWFQDEVFVILDAGLSHAAEKVPVPAAANAAPPYGAQLTTLSYGLGYAPQALAAANSSARNALENIGTLGGRLPLYKAGWHYMLHNRYCFLFGVTPAQAVEVLRGTFGVREQYQYAHMHNWFFQMGMSYGVPILLATLVFAARTVFRGLRMIFLPSKMLFPGVWMIPLLVLTILLSDMLEAELDAAQHCICNIFYLFSGWMLVLDTEDRQYDAVKGVKF